MRLEKPREIAANILQAWELGEQRLELLLEQELASKKLAPIDRPLVHELVLGVVRWQKAIDHLIDQKVPQKPKPGLQILLRLGIYQIFWLSRIPAHAAVHETVELARKIGFKNQAGFVNAVLRNLLREQDQTRDLLRQLQSTNLPLGYSHPEWLCQLWEKRWGIAETRRLLEWNNSPASVFARINTLKIEPAQLFKSWETEGVEFRPVEVEWAPAGLMYELLRHPSLATLDSFNSGFYYLQDPSTLLAVQELNPQPGEKILDLCAAPGGKTTFIAQRMFNQGAVYAFDPQLERLQLLHENCRRLGAAAVKPMTSADLRLAEVNDLRFDRILLDVPCSNTGVMRRRVDLRWRIREADLPKIRRTQRELLDRAVPLLKPGGTLVYSTCSIEPDENEQLLDAWLNTEQGRKMTLLRARTLLPFRDKVDGAFVAALVSKRT